MDDYQFKLNQKVRLTLSGEKGVVRARMESVAADPLYSVAYKAADGRQVDNWIAEDLLADDEPAES